MKAANLINLMECQLASAREKIQRLIRGEEIDFRRFEDEYWATKRYIEQWREERK